MKRFQIARGLVALACLVAAIGLAGCDDNSLYDVPENISGTWSCTFTRAGEAALSETWSINQSGSTVSGSYTFKEESYTFSGTYVDGRLSAVDSDNWTLSLEFEKDDKGNGTIAGNSGDESYQVWNADLWR